MNLLTSTFYMRPKYYYQDFPKKVTHEKLKSSTLNRDISPLFIGIFVGLGILVISLFILAESLQVGKKPKFITAKCL